MLPAPSAAASAVIAGLLWPVAALLCTYAFGGSCARAARVCWRMWSGAPPLSQAMPPLRPPAATPPPPPPGTPIANRTLAEVLLMQLWARFPAPGERPEESADLALAFNSFERQAATAQRVRARLVDLQAQSEALIAGNGGPDAPGARGYAAGPESGLAGKTALRIAAVDARIAEIEAGADGLLAAQRRDCGNMACAEGGARPRMSCANCGARYCSEACQAAHWEAHKPVCLCTLYELHYGT